MFDLSMPWWEFIVRATLVYLVLMLMVRMTGKRTVGQFTPFDLLVVMLLSEAVSSSLTGNDDSVVGGLIAAGSLLLLNVAFAILSSRSVRIEQMTEGSPVLVGRDGKIFHDVLKRERVGLGELERALREADCDLGEMHCAFLETDGNFSILKKKH